jgi:hypothetical protein
MEKTDVVSNAVYTGRSFNTQYGQMFVHAITFGNGDSGEYNSKSETQDKFVIGKEVKYTIEPNSNPQYAARIKPVTDFAPSSGGSYQKKDNTATQRSIERQQALKLAIEYHAKEQEQKQPSAIALTAEYFYQWISEPATETKTVATPTPGQPSPVTEQKVSDMPPNW